MSGDDEEIDTGFDAVLAGEVYVPPVGEPQLTAAVSEEAATSTQISDANKALIGELPKDFDRVTMAKLAREIAMDIKERHAILKEHGLTQVQYEYLSEHNPYFKNALEAAIREWQSPLSTPERVSIAAAAILEDSLPGLGARMQNRGEGLPGVIEAAKFFGKLAGIGERASGGAPTGERFVINIDLGGGQTVAVAAGEAPSRDPLLPVGLALPQVIEVQSNPGGVGTDAEGARVQKPTKREP